MSVKILNNVRLIQKCIIVGKDGKILALKRAADDHSRGGNWDLPGGGYEQGELVEDAIRREVMEEVGLSALELTPVYFTNKIGVKEGFFQGENVFGICYYCRVWTGEIRLSDEHTEYQWFTPQDFMKLDFGADSGFFVASMRSYTTLLA
jgi:8-oxo-dGTP pyrophosphatase MutT (NUDIX family)